MSNKAYSYIRFSSPEQARGDSRRRQLEAANLYAAKNNLELVKDAEYEFFDAGISAYRGKNNSDSGKLKRFFDYVENGSIEPGSYLLVESLDRLSREDILIALPRFLDLLNAGIKVVTLTDEIVYSQAAQATQLVMSIFHMARAHEESRLKAERVSKAWKQKQKDARFESKPIGAVCPYWLNYIDGRYVPDSERVKVVKNIFEWTIAGYGQISVVKKLNDAEVPVFGSTARNKSRLWGTSTISKILGNRSVLGEYQPTVRAAGNRRVADGPAIEGYYPPVIDESIFYAAQNARSQRRKYSDTKQSKRFNIWSKIAVCAHCKSTMNMVNKGKPPKGNVYLRCSAAAKGKCNNKHFRYDSAEKVFSEILAKLNSISLVKNNARELNARVSELKGRIDAAMRTLETMQSILLDTPSATLSKAAAIKEDELSVYERELSEALKEQASEIVVNKEDFFKKLDLSSYEGRAAANYFVRSLNVSVKIKKLGGVDIFLVTIAKLPKFAIEVNETCDISIYILSASALDAVLNQNDLNSAKLMLPSRNGIRNALRRTAGNGRGFVDFKYSDMKLIPVGRGPEMASLMLSTLLVDCDE